MASRRRILTRIAGITGVSSLSGCVGFLDRSDDSDRDLGLPSNPLADELPDGQHEWNDHLRRDTHDTPLSPRHHAVVLLELDEPPSIEAARTVERAMRTLEAAYPWSSDGLLHVLVWGTAYFERIGELDRAPIEPPEVISRTDEPDLLDFDAALVMSSDVESHLKAAEAAMFDDRDAVNDEDVEDRLGDVFSRVGARTGFIGEGLPAAHADAEGIPNPDAVDEDAPMFMGFFSGRPGTQASEERVTIDSGEFAGGTTMHLSHLRQNLDAWYDVLDQSGRVARMFSPEADPEDLDGFTDDVSFENDPAENAADHGVVGHHEKLLRARRDGEPIILRRDFNTVDDGHAGVHFLSFQESIDDFVETRDAMNGWWLRRESDSIRDRKNNGILEFVTVTSRANFYVPPRDRRAFPLL